MYLCFLLARLEIYSSLRHFFLFFVGLKNLMDQVIEIDQGQGRSQGHSDGQGTSSGRSSQAFQIQNYMLHRMSILEVTLFWQVFLEQNYFLRYCQYFFCKLLCENRSNQFLSLTQSFPRAGACPTDLSFHHTQP